MSQDPTGKSFFSLVKKSNLAWSLVTCGLFRPKQARSSEIKCDQVFGTKSDVQCPCVFAWVHCSHESSSSAAISIVKGLSTRKIAFIDTEYSSSEFQSGWAHLTPLLPRPITNIFRQVVHAKGSGAHGYVCLTSFDSACSLAYIDFSSKSLPISPMWIRSALNFSLPDHLDHHGGPLFRGCGYKGPFNHAFLHGGRGVWLARYQPRPSRVSFSWDANNSFLLTFVASFAIKMRTSQGIWDWGVLFCLLSLSQRWP